VTLVGAVLGQQTISPTAAAADGGGALVSAAFADIATVSPVRPGHVRGRIVAPPGDRRSLAPSAGPA